jgi:hypothetical protein
VCHEQVGNWWRAWRAHGEAPDLAIGDAVELQEVEAQHDLEGPDGDVRGAEFLAYI